MLDANLPSNYCGTSLNLLQYVHASSTGNPQLETAFQMCLTTSLGLLVIVLSVPSMYSCGSYSSQVQDFAFPFIELHKTPVGPFLKPFVVSLSGDTTIW